MKKKKIMITEMKAGLLNEGHTKIKGKLCTGCGTRIATTIVKNARNSVWKLLNQSTKRVKIIQNTKSIFFCSI